MEKKENKKVWGICAISISVVFVIIAIFLIFREKQEFRSIENIEENKILNNNLESSKYFQDPDRIIYKEKNEDKYYIFEKDEKGYNEIVKQFYAGVDTKKEGSNLNINDIENIKNQERFIEFDYNQVSKNYIFPIEKDGYNMISLNDNGGQIYQSNILYKDSIKAVIDKNTNGKKSYKMRDNKLYISQNVLQQVNNNIDKIKKYDNDIYQIKIDNIKDYEELKNRYNISIPNVTIDEKTFEDFNIVANISKFDIKEVNSNIGNIKYIYEGTFNYNAKIYYPYKLSIYVVSKVVNTNCIYRNMDNVQIIDNMQENISKQENQNTQEISKEKAIEIWKENLNTLWKDGYKVINHEDYTTLIDIKKDEKAPNNQFTAKQYDSLKNSGNIRPVWVLTTGEEQNAIQILEIYIDIYNGNIIGGRISGD